VERCAGGTSLVQVRGELDMFDAPQLGRLLDAERAAGHDLVVDLRRLTFIDSSGLAVLVWRPSRPPGPAAVCDCSRRRPR
jgi:anti-sigma B factor antagonist